MRLRSKHGTCFDNSVHAGVGQGITIDKLQADIEFLLSEDIVDHKILFEWCDAIDSVTVELDRLYKLIEITLPHKTKVERKIIESLPGNSLLSMMFDIQYTQQQFTQGINKVKNRVRKITQGKGQADFF